MLREKNNIKKHTHDTRVKLKRLKEVHMTKTHTEASSGLYKDTCGHMSEVFSLKRQETHGFHRHSSLGRLSLDV